MNHYIEITLIPDSEIGLHFLWSKVFQQIHFALVEMKQEDERIPIGVHFPDYSKESKYLGKRVRLFASSIAELEALNIQHWLKRLADYTHIKPVKPVPCAVTGYVLVKRIQPKGNPEKLARRYAKRHDESEEKALLLFQQRGNQCDHLPYIQLQSASNGHHFRLYIDQAESNQKNNVEFNSYGMSTTTSLPHFET